MSSRKMISLTQKTYKKLAKMGTLEDSFDSVIQRMIEREKNATAGHTVEGTDQTVVTASSEGAVND
jgi:predicted CopG family antitoxin